MLHRAGRGLIGLMVLVGMAGRLPADQFAIHIKAEVGEKKKVETKHTEEASPLNEPQERPVLKTDRQNELEIEWTAENTAEEKAFKDVLVHFFVVKEKQAGQKKVPKLDQDVLYEGALNMDFKPGAKAQGVFTLKLPESGAYLLRVETLRILNQHEHEHYAAMDLVAE